MWLQPPLLREHWSVGTGRACHLLVPLLGHPVSPRPAPRSPHSSPSSEPSPQSSEPSQSFSGGRQMEVLLAQVCEGGLHTRDSQFSSSELSSQSLSPSQTQALLMHRADGEGAEQNQMLLQAFPDVIPCTGGMGVFGAPQKLDQGWPRQDRSGKGLGEAHGSTGGSEGHPQNWRPSSLVPNPSKCVPVPSSEKGRRDLRMTPSMRITVHGLAACVSPLSQHQGESSTPRWDPLSPRSHQSPCSRI